MQSAQELTGEGRRLRHDTPREALGEWRRPKSRMDPIAILRAADAIRRKELLPLRYGRMLQSPFAFYRGSAAVMAADLAHSPVTGIHVQACGDCHLMNFGGFATPERRLIFDINDFDETLPAPWEWDLKRLATSFFIAGRHNSFKKVDSRAVALSCAKAYRERMRQYAGFGALEMWYQRIEIDTLIASIKSKKWKRILQQQVNKALARTSVVDLKKLATIEGGQARIKDKLPLIFHQTELDAAEYEHVVKNAVSRYQETRSDDLKVLLDRYDVKDVATKVVGVGSVGTRCFIVLLMASETDALFIQVKEAHESVLELFAGKSVYPNHGQRVVAGQRLMQAASDIFLGWTEEQGHFYVRQLRDNKITPILEIQDERMLADYAGWCGWALARAHAKSGDATAISGHIGKSKK